MKRAFLLFAVAILYCNPTLAQEPDPDPNLMWVADTTWKVGFQSFLIHPNGNIIAGLGPDEIELDGNTGKIVRGFPFQFPSFSDISPDGKYILERTSMIDYQTLEVIANIPRHSRFLSDSKTLIYPVIEGFGWNAITTLATYNIETEEKRIGSKSQVNTRVTNIRVSPDGKFLAATAEYFEYGKSYIASFALWDTETLKPICILNKINNSGWESIIKFSPESRLVGFRVNFNELYIYKTDDCTLYKKFDRYNTDSPIDGFCFIDENHIGYKYERETYILRLSDEKIIFKNTSEAQKAQPTSIIEKNHFNNSLIASYQVMLAWDLNKIMSGTSIETEPKITNPFTVEYLNNSLSISNFTFGTNSINCTITDINGRVLHNTNLNSSTNEIRIPIKLLSGTYFLHIKDGGKEYVSKFWVVN